VIEENKVFRLMGKFNNSLFIVIIMMSIVYVFFEVSLDRSNNLVNVGFTTVVNTLIFMFDASKILFNIFVMIEVSFNIPLR
jgi:hypothetical protein